MHHDHLDHLHAQRTEVPSGVGRDLRWISAPHWMHTPAPSLDALTVARSSAEADTSCLNPRRKVCDVSV